MWSKLLFFQSDRGPQQSNQSDTERQAGSVYFIGEEYSYDSVGTVRTPASLIVPLGPSLHHAGRNHEPDGGDSATGGTADDDQEGAAYHCATLCVGDLKTCFTGLIVTRGH